MLRRGSCCCCSTTASTWSTPAPSWPTRCCARCPALTILATSREPLRHRRRDRSSACPRCHACRDRRRPSRRPSASRSRAAVRRARARPRTGLRARPRPMRRRSPRSAAASTASRWRSNWRPPASRSLSIEEINARLDDRFSLLTGGSPHGAAAPADAARRRSTGATTCSTSTSASVPPPGGLRGGFTLEAARLSPPTTRIDEFGGDRSARTARRAVAGRRRYQRTGYALSAARDDARLRAARSSARGRRDRGRSRPSRAVLSRSVRVAHPWRGCISPDANWHAIYGPELDNLRAALEWALGAGMAIRGPPSPWPARQVRMWIELFALR